MRKDYSSWKQKIDPAFPKIIKYVLTSLKNADLPDSSGWLIMEPYYLEQLEKKGLQGWIKNYEKEISNSIIKSDNSSLRKMTVDELTKHRNDFCKELKEKIQILPIDSQEYYKNIFLNCFSQKQDFKEKLSKTELIKITRRIMVDLFVLEVFTLVAKLEREIKNTSLVEVQKPFNKPKFFIDFMLSYYNSVSILVHKKPFYELLREGKRGDRESFFKLLQIDRTVTELEWAQKMIRKAQLTGDEMFFQKMGKSISTSPLENTKLHGEELIVLLMLWQWGLDRLTNNELIHLLETSGLKKQYNEETFRKFVTRQIRPAFKNHFIQVNYTPI